jgi:hypothetical protein
MENVKYTKFGMISAIIDGNVVLIPDDPRNRYREMISEWESKGNVIAPYIHENTREEVNIERDNRIAKGFMFMGTMFDFDASSKQRIAGAATLAGFAMTMGAQPGNFKWHSGETDFAWIAQNNKIIKMDAQTTFMLGKTAAKHEEDHIFAAATLKSIDPIPNDYYEDKYWPTIE